MSLYIHTFTFLILVKFSGCAQWSFCNFIFIEFQSLSKSLVYFSWLMKMSSLSCLIWRPRKKLNSPILFISNSLGIHLENSFRKKVEIYKQMVHLEAKKMAKKEESFLHQMIWRTQEENKKDLLLFHTLSSLGFTFVFAFHT